MKQVEAQLERHKEALVRLRDLSTTEKNELTVRLKDVEKVCVSVMRSGKLKDGLLETACLHYDPMHVYSKELWLKIVHFC